MRELNRLNMLFDFSLYALVVVPYLAILAGQGVGLPMGIGFGIGVVASYFFHRRGLANQGQATWWNTIVIAYIIFAVGELFLTERSVLDSGIRLVLILTLIKLFSRISERDELQIVALSFLMLSAATTVNEDVTFGILFALYVLIGTFTLAVFHLRSELRGHPRLALYGGAPINRAYVGVLAGISALILAASLSIFFLFPRIGLGFFAQQQRDGVSVTGFNESVQLGGHGAIRDNPEVVMRVEFPDGKWPEHEIAGLHWRTMTLDRYDGRGWSQSFERHRRLLPRGDGKQWDLTSIHPRGETRGRLQIYLEPLGTNLLPVLWPSESLRLGSTEFVMPWGPRAAHLQRDAYGDVRHTMESEVGIAYLLTVAENPTEPPRRLREPDEQYLQLPEISQRVRDLGTQIIDGIDGRQAQAEAIERHLESTYSYTTDLPPVGADPIDSFLFEARRGHCEYFASAMVVLLRANGVPARMVNGFLGGKWNEVGGYLAVRQGDAHSWVEYWDPEFGWRPIDPTPAAEAIPEVPLLDSMREYWDAMRLAWMKWVIEYDLNAQVEFFRNAARVLEPKSETQAEGRELDDRGKRTGDWRTALLIGGIATLIFLGFARTRRRLRRHDRPWKTGMTVVFYMGAGAVWFAWFRGFETLQYVSGASLVGVGVVVAFFESARNASSQTPLIQTFDRIEHAAKRAGLARRTDEGPAEFLQRIADERPALTEDIERYRVWYLRARFGPGTTEPDEVTRLRNIARRIVAGLRKD